MTSHNLSTHRGSMVLAFTLFVLSHGALASEPLELVSPGGEDELLAVSSPCPTFSWGRDAALRAERYELVVMPVEGTSLDDTEIGDPVLIERIPANATSWTPPGSVCLDAGRSYAWSLRAVGGASPGEAESEEWAAPRFFTVPALPGPREVREALAVLRAAGLVDAAEPADEPAEPAASPAAPRASGAARSSRSVANAKVRIASALATADRTGLKTSLATGPEIGFGVHGVAATAGAGSAGVVGEATATSGPVHGIIGVTRSVDGVAGLFENSAGGPILKGLGAGGEVFSVDPSGLVTAAAFTGSGSGLADLPWASLTNVPSGFADGVDQDTTYQAGSGLGLSGTTLRVTGLPMEMYVEAQKVAVATVAKHPSILIGRDGLPLIAYHEANSGDLRVVHCEDTICSQQTSATLDSGGFVGEFNDITLGRDGNALISYYDRSGGQLKLAHCVDVPCSAADLTVVDTTGDVGQYSSITTDSNGYAFIAYYDTGGSLKAVRCSNLACTSKTTWTIDSGNVGEYASITRTSNGRIFISYYDAANGDLKLAQCSGNSCATPTIYVVASTDDSGKFSAMTTAVDGHVAIAHVVTNASGFERLDVSRCDTHFSCSSPTHDTVAGSGSPGPIFRGLAITRGADGLILGTSAIASTRVWTFHCKDPACSDTTATSSTVSSLKPSDTAITIGSDRLPIVAYTSDADGDVYIAHCSERSCQAYLREP